MEKKKVILTLCKRFPANNPKAGKPTGFEDELKKGTKIHTIRGNAKNVWEGRYNDIASGKKYLSVREWTGRPYNSEQREFARFERIGLQHITMSYCSTDEVPQVWIDDKKVPFEEVAHNDALSEEDFISFFFQKSNVFDGVVIHFTDYRY